MTGTNVGGVEFDVNVRGIEKEIKNVDSLVHNLEQLNDKLVKGKKSKEQNAIATKKSLDGLRLVSEANKKYLSGIKDTTTGLTRMLRVQKSLGAELKEVRRIERTKASPVLRGIAEARQKARMVIINNQVLKSEQMLAAAKQRTARAASLAGIAQVKAASASRLATAQVEKAEAQALLTRARLTKELVTIRIAKKKLAQMDSKLALAADKLALAQKRQADVAKLNASRIAVNLARIKQMSSGVKKLTGRIRENSRAGTSWIKRFTVIAGGFALAHAAISRLSQGVNLLTSTFARGASIADEYQEGVATISGMVAITSKGMGGFQNRFASVNAIMQETMREAIRLAPTYRLSMEEITAGFRELSQFGVIVQKGMVRSSIVTLNAIKEIAVSSGSSVKGIRQELQAMFTGTARASDQFAKMIKTTMPDVWKQLKDPAIDASEKWKIVTDRWKDFALAAEAASRTLKGQFEKLRIGVSLISQEAIAGSGVYDLWVNRLVDLNKQLFTEAGELTKAGRRMKGVFEGVWNAMNNVMGLAGQLFVTFRSFGNLVGDINPRILDLAKHMLTIVVGGRLALVAFKGLLGVFKLLGALTGVTALFKGISTVFSAAFLLRMKKFVIAFAAMASPILAAVGAIALGVAAGLAFRNAWGAVAELVGQLSQREFWQGMAQQAKGAFGILMAIIKNPFDNAARQEAINKINAGLQDIHKGIDWGKVADAGRAEGQNYIEGLLGFKDTLVDGLSDIKTKLTSFATENLFTGGTETLNSFGEEVDALKGKLQELLSGFREGTPQGDLSNVLPEFSPTKLKNVEAYVNLMQKLSDNLKSTWSELFSGKLEGFSDLWSSIMNNMVKTFQDAMADMTQAYVKDFLQVIATKAGGEGQGGLAGFIGKGIGALFGTENTGAKKGADSQNATGGLISERVVGIGLSTGRSFSFGEQGQERVLSAKDTRSSMQGAAPVIQITNNSSARVKSSQTAPKFKGKQWVVQALLEDYAGGGQTKQVFG